MQHTNRLQATLQSWKGPAAGRTADDSTGAQMRCRLQCVIQHTRHCSMHMIVMSCDSHVHAVLKRLLVTWVVCKVGP